MFVFTSILLVATAPTVYGIETTANNTIYLSSILKVATAPTVYGIETMLSIKIVDSASLLQQHLPFTVLKLSINNVSKSK